MESDKKYWNVPRGTAELLRALASRKDVRKILEIGTSNGYSGIFLAEALSHKKGILYTVESHRGRFDEARKNFRGAGLEKFVVQVYGHAPEVFWKGDEHGERAKNQTGRGELAEEYGFDMVFMDATKMEYAQYLEDILPRLREGGFIVADNCVSHGEELDEFFRLLDAYARKGVLKWGLLKNDNGLVVAEKLKDAKGS
jgi:predicted O-methyltransferase YrrM